MPYLSNSQLEAFRHTVTGIGWANTAQAAIYTGLSYRKFCKLIKTAHIRPAIIGGEKRYKYTDLDELMESFKVSNVDIDRILREVASC